MILNIFCLLLAVHQAFAQGNSALDKFDEFRKHNFQEKVYVTTDREFYLVGEMMWFKVYGMDGSLHLPTDLSRIAYLEVLSADSVAQMQVKVELEEGTGSGSMYIPTTMVSGRYLLRAYTNWMKNYDPAFYFEKELTIVNTFRRLPPLPSSESISLQFYPEGGQLVSAIETKVAFQVTNLPANQAAFRGVLQNNLGDTVLHFSPEHAGMGSFRFTPEKDMSYKAAINWGDETFITELPEVAESGHVLSLERKDDMVNVSVHANTEEDGLFLLVQSRNMVSHAVYKELSNGRASFSIKMEDLAEGINHFTLFDNNSIPVAERLFFKQPNNLMSIVIQGNQRQHAEKEMVNYQIRAAENAKLSMSVYKLDSLNKEPGLNIVDYLYLTSDLHARIHNPSYYLHHQTPVQHIDLLMMVHGWSRFEWKDVMNPIEAEKKYVPEVRGHLIQGAISHQESGLPGENVNAYLSVTGQYPRFYVSRSDAQGRIKFELQDSYGDADIVFGTNQLQDSAYAVKVWDAFSKEYQTFENQDLDMDQRFATPLIDRSVGMQTMNIYQEANINNYTAAGSDTALFFMKGDKHYRLDDYTRFSSMEDIMREYMPEVFVNVNKAGFSLRILDDEREVKYEDNPLVLYDGVPVFDMNKFMAIDPHSIKSIDVIRKRYFYGKSTFDGIISCSSYEQDLEGLTIDPTSLLINYKFAQLQRSFYTPDYGTIANSTIPDRRNLLFWKADMVTNKDGIADVEFSTSEESGKYMVVIEGISPAGIPGYTTFTFEVNKEAN